MLRGGTLGLLLLWSGSCRLPFVRFMSRRSGRRGVVGFAAVGVLFFGQDDPARRECPKRRNPLRLGAPCDGPHRIAAAQKYVESKYKHALLLKKGKKKERTS